MEGAVVPASTSAVVLRGVGEGTGRDLEAGGPRAPAFRCCGVVWRARGVLALRPLPARPAWRLLVSPEKPATEVPGERGRRSSVTAQSLGPGVSVRSCVLPVYEHILPSPCPTP